MMGVGGDKEMMKRKGRRAGVKKEGGIRGG